MTTFRERVEALKMSKWPYHGGSATRAKHWNAALDAVLALCEVSGDSGTLEPFDKIEELDSGTPDAPSFWKAEDRAAILDCYQKVRDGNDPDHIWLDTLKAHAVTLLDEVLAASPEGARDAGADTRQKLYRWQYEDEAVDNSYFTQGPVRYSVVEPLAIRTRPIRCRLFVASGDEYRIMDDSAMSPSPEPTK